MLHVVIGGMQSAIFCILSYQQVKSFYLYLRMDNLSNTCYAKFSTQQKVIYFGQHGFSSRTDSFGDIPGHGVICIYLDLLVLWTLKSSLVLVSGTSFVDHKKEPIEGFKWSGMPIGEKRFNSCQVCWMLVTQW